MYNSETLKTAYQGLIGFRGVTGFATPRSGLFIDSHALLTKTNVEKATDSGATGLIANIGRVIDDALPMVLMGVRTRKLARLESRFSLLAANPLFEGDGSIYDSITPSGMFVGLRLTLTEGYARTVRLTRVGLQTLDGHEPLDLYVYRNGVQLSVTELTAQTGNLTRWQDVTLTLSPGAVYLIGYYESELGDARAVRRLKTIDIMPCPGCTPRNAALRAGWKPYMDIDAIRVTSEQLDGDGRVDADSDVQVIENTNWGLNLTVAVDCDLTPVLLSQEMILAPAILQQAIVSLLNQIAFSSQTSGLEQQIRDKAMFALKNGEEKKLSDALDAVDIELSGLDPKCLPLKDTSALVRRKTVFR